MVSQTGVWPGTVLTELGTPSELLHSTAHALQFHQTVLNGGCKYGCDRKRTDTSRLPWDTDAYGGWGGSGPMPRVSPPEHTPVVFVHGNQRDACDWEVHRNQFKEHGYQSDELWAITFRSASPTHDEMATQLDDFITRVQDYTRADCVAVVAHSLGVTGTRYWLQTHDRYDHVETVVALAGANHGVQFATACCKLGIDVGPYRVSEFVRSDYWEFDDHPLQTLNDNETPGDVQYTTIRGEDDILYQNNPESPVLEGADENISLPTGHDGVRTDRAARNIIYGTVSQ